MNFTPAQRRTLAWMGLALVAWGALNLLGPVLTPFLAGGALAYVLRPAMLRLQRLGLPRAPAALLVEVVALALLLMALLLLVPILTKELPALREQVPPLLDRLDTTLAPWLAQFGIEVSLDLGSLKAWAAQILSTKGEDWAGAFFNQLKLGGSVLLSVAGNAVLIPVVIFFLLMDGEALMGRAMALVPPSRRAAVQAFLAECDQTLGGYLRGQLMVMVILAVYYAGALALAGFQLAVPVGVFTGLAVFIPYLGFGLGLAMAVLAAVLQFEGLQGLLWVAAIYGVGQVVESFVLTPRLVGERIGLSPLAVIFALMAFGQLFGFVGVLVALPASAVAVVAARWLKRAYLASSLYRS